MQSEITQMLFDNIEYIVGSGGAVVVIILYQLVYKKRIRHSSNDLTQMVVDYNKRKDQISKRTKSII